MDHPNIARFFGVSFPFRAEDSEAYLRLVGESPSKGLLRKLIDQEDLTFDWDLRFSLIWDIISVSPAVIC